MKNCCNYSNWLKILSSRKFLTNTVFSTISLTMYKPPSCFSLSLEANVSCLNISKIVWCVTVFPYILSLENYSFFNLKIIANLNSCHNISISYLIHWFFAAETIRWTTMFIYLCLLFFNIFFFFFPAASPTASAISTTTQF